MPMNPIEAPAALDARMRETAVGAKSRKPTQQSEPGAVPAAPASPAPGSAQETQQQLQLQLQQQLQQEHQQAPAENAPNQPLPTAMNLKFSTDEQTGKSVVALVDPVDGKVLRQFPSEEALKVAEQIGRFQGMFVDLKV